MAVVISGSGTVTGISVGGLPDGIVDSGTLATDSVDSAELIDGAIDAAHLASGVRGKALQVVSMETSALNTTSSTSYVDSTITLAITPSATSSKVLVMYEVNGVAKDVTASKVQILLKRDSTDLKAISDVLADGITDDRSHIAGFDLDSPSTTSATTYKIQYKRVSGSGDVNINKVSSTAQTTSSITLMEIGA